MMSRFLLKRGNLKKSKEMVEKALEIDPLDVDNLTQLGIVYYELRDYRKAEKFVRSALKIDPDDFDANYFMSLLNEKLGIESENNLLELEYSETAIIHEAEKLMKKKEFEKAVEVLRKGMVEYPINEEIRSNFLLYKALSAPFIKHFFIFTRNFYELDDFSNWKKWFLVRCLMVGLFVFIPILYIYTLVLKFYYKKQLKNGKI